MTDLPGYQPYTTPSGVPVLLRFEQNDKGRWVITGLHLERPADASIDSQVLRMLQLAPIEATVNGQRFRPDSLSTLG